MLAFRPWMATYANPPALAGNVITNPYDMANASWNSVTNLTRTSDATLAPDGSMNGDKVFATTTNNVHTMSQTGMTVSATRYIIRARIKPAGYSLLELVFASNNSYTNAASLMFDASTRNPVRAGSTQGTYRVESSRTLELTNGWTLCEIVTNTQSANSTHRIDVSLYRDVATNSWAGDNFSGLYIWGVEFAPVPN